MDLFDPVTDADRQRLRAAGWSECTYCGGPGWLSPDKKSMFSEAEALRHLERQEKEGQRAEEA